MNNKLIFIVMLLIGSEKIGINMWGFNFKIIQLLVFFTGGVFLLKGKFKIKNFVLFSLFLISNIISTLNSNDIKQSIFYILLTIFNYIFIFCLFYSWSYEENEENILRLWFKTFIIQGIYLCIQFFMGIFGKEDIFFGTDIFNGIPRPGIWFYEPSYLATYLIIYFSVSVYLYLNGKKNCAKHIILSLIFITLTTSSTGFLGIIIASIVILLINIFNVKKTINNFKFILLIALSSFCIYIATKDYISYFILRMFSNDLIGASGGRIESWSIGLKVFEDNMIWGVGPSGYQSYLGVNFPPSNVTLELLINLGIVGAFLFMLFMMYPLYKGHKLNKSLKEDSLQILKAFVLSFVIFFIVLQANQNYLRSYMWMHLGIIHGITDKLRYKLNKKIDL